MTSSNPYLKIAVDAPAVTAFPEIPRIAGIARKAIRASLALIIALLAMPAAVIIISGFAFAVRSSQNSIRGMGARAACGGRLKTGCAFIRAI